MSIRIFYDETDFRLQGLRKTVKTVKTVILNEEKILGDLNFILTNNENLREISNEFLKHNYDTDVITFNYNKENIISGEIYISVEKVTENAINYNVSIRSEIRRVILHGVLHLLGYNDKSDEEKVKMKEMEDLLLKIYGE